jgi:hypothetical protein
MVAESLPWPIFSACEVTMNLWIVVARWFCCAHGIPSQEEMLKEYRTADHKFLLSVDLLRLIHRFHSMRSNRQDS